MEFKTAMMHYSAFKTDPSQVLVRQQKTVRVQRGGQEGRVHPDPRHRHPINRGLRGH